MAHKNNLILRILSTFLMAPIVLLTVYFGGNSFNILLIFILLVGLYEILQIKKFFFRFIILLLFISFLFSCFELRNLQNGKNHLFLLIIITWLSDMGGYFFGKYIGGKKINFISPNKTYIGFLGSILFVLLSIIFINNTNINFSDNILKNYLLLIFGSFLVIIGDLLFSFFKRKTGVKDFSNIIPGHGGLFDRIDGMIILTIVYYIFVKNL